MLGAINMRMKLLIALILATYLNAAIFDDNKKSILELQVTTIANTQKNGSAVNISKDGKLITAYHAIDDAKSIKAIDSNGVVYNATVGMVSVKNDLAYLDINTSVIPAVAINEEPIWSEEIYTLAGDGTLLKGIVSKIDDNGIFISYELPAGNSGGGVFNKAGELIAVISRTHINEGVTYATKVNMFKDIVEEFTYQETLDMKSNNYDYSYCTTDETLNSWKKIIKSGNIKSHTLHAIFLGLCEKVKRKDMTTEEADYIFFENRKRLFGI